MFAWLRRFAFMALLSSAGHGQLLQGQNAPDPFDTFNSSDRPVSEQGRAPFNTGLISVTRAAHKIPKNVAAEFKRAIQQKQKQPMEALAHFLEATRLDPLYWDAHANLADLYWALGRQSEALDSLNAALAIDPNSDALQTNKAVALLNLGHPEDAEQAAWRALRLKPASPEAHYLIGLAQLGQGKVDRETVAHLAQAIGKIPQARQIHADAEEILSRHVPSTTAAR